MSTLILIVFLLYVAFHVLDGLTGPVFELAKRIFGGKVENLLQTLICKISKLDRPKGSIPARFACIVGVPESADAVFIAGAFNGWLQAKDGTIHPYTWQEKTFGMQKVVELTDKSHVRWEKEVWLKPGPYDFKFVVGKSQWVPWSRNCGYQRGNKAPEGDFNMRAIVKD